jgi:NAD(P)-dependent dehydrogenase (short-subunit alcohol dehydrogenase family)
VEQALLIVVMASRVILVTGGNQGIGYQVVRQLAQLGHHVYLGSRNAEKGLEAVSKLHNENLTTVRPLTIDVTSQESVDAAAQHLAAQHAHLDVLVNNAAIATEEFSVDASKPDVEQIRGIFETNFFGVLRVTNAFVPFLRKSANPVILNVSSGLGSVTHQADPSGPYASVQLPGYNSSKSALNAYTVTLSYAFPEARVNVISPGYVATNLNNYRGILTPEESAKGVIKYGILLDKTGPTRTFLDHTGNTTWPW